MHVLGNATVMDCKCSIPLVLEHTVTHKEQNKDIATINFQGQIDVSRHKCEKTK